jgi:hypothetical protein
MAEAVTFLVSAQAILASFSSQSFFDPSAVRSITVVCEKVSEALSALDGLSVTQWIKGRACADIGCSFPYARGYPPGEAPTGVTGPLSAPDCLGPGILPRPSMRRSGQRYERANSERRCRQPDPSRNDSQPLHLIPLACKDTLAPHHHRNGWKWTRRRPLDHRAGLCVELTAVARTSDNPFLDRPHCAALVSTYGGQTMHRAALSSHKYDLVLSQDQPSTYAWDLAEMGKELSITTGGIRRCRAARRGRPLVVCHQIPGDAGDGCDRTPADYGPS